MQNHSFSILQTVAQKGFPFILSFVDDAVLMIATRVGLQLPWLQWLSTILLVATLLYWTVRLVRYWYINHALAEPGPKLKA
ncbi:hypothetical protein [Leptothoe sp. PORK10 BA2]|uniref:hypothetical protein n=1 Tax=Leptothoe sp. PORK10 BA2 TaxID=3110254 RepID=UPI002B200BE0|nr:hypothetical protein [Leptothoe sp. PORK10 BA2]MEA5464077.1 hypothetical protein [Leptothoe sp. PORK10 BA2]